MLIQYGLKDLFPLHQLSIEVVYGHWWQHKQNNGEG